MADPATYRPATGEIPTRPGVYRFKDDQSRVIYVGKAKNLRSRLTSYFARPETLHAKTRAMVHTAAGVEWTVVGSELEAIQLEYTWIKQYTPRFNIMYRDDKSYPYLAVTMDEKYPRVMVMRGDRRKGVKYFGPFHPAKAIRETVDRMLRVFPVRTCSAGVFRRAEMSGRPCLMGYIDKCSAPCVGRISVEDHYRLAEDFCNFMTGNVSGYLRELEAEMKSAVDELRYEDAARRRDDIAALKRVFERNAVVLSENTEADVFAFAEDELEAAVQVFHIRGGRIRGQRGWVVEKVEETTSEQLVQQLIQQVYGDLDDVSRIPAEVLVPALPSEPEELSEWLTERRGSRVDLRVPRRGDKKALLETVAENADLALRSHKTKRSGDITTRSAALRELQDALELPEPLLRIECYDISHVQGTNVVGSMVVVEDGLPQKSAYRKFAVTGDAARDDTTAMHDVLTRRFKSYLREQTETPEVVSGEIDEDDTSEKKRFSYPPSLVVVDGGPAQVSSAQSALIELGVTDIPVVGLAKRLEELWLPGEEFPVVLPRTSEGLYLLQRIRDESHRFAISFHRDKRSKSMVQSALDEIPGLGPAKRKLLLKQFGSIKRLRAASIDELTAVKGIGPQLAQAIRENLGTKDSAKSKDSAESVG
ncbi:MULTISPECIES: excinuclease ABC subunit UvrC [Citricoccus]|uniref:UvrABC system protein C n=1 Tax=Citricoccus muralis TaxID=169134 RepID=A0ABY8H2D5_9MICC|nr:MULTISPECIES: excinuclease ABC subunit UvrC [Citricoccus]WBL18332.1 excinuclease ABC subunit UvrC [Citricoccus sp. NR2]WFP15291.1 excinuclease ABC subunit UvrC [Citricoccus muralis]